MMNEIRIIAISELGTKALRQMIIEDENESTSNKNKVAKEWELKILSENPLTYSAKTKPAMQEELKSNARRIGHLMNTSVEVMVDTLVSTVKSHTITRMGKNGAIKKIDYKIKVLTDDDDD